MRYREFIARDLYFQNHFVRDKEAQSCLYASRGIPRGHPRKTHDYCRMRKDIMTRKYIDCREFPSEMNCSVALSADSENELLEAAVQHAVAVHKHADSPELRSQLKALFHDGTPPVETPRQA